MRSELNGESFLPRKFKICSPSWNFHRLAKCFGHTWYLHPWIFFINFFLGRSFGKKDSPLNSERISYRVHGSAIFPQGVMNFWNFLKFRTFENFGPLDLGLKKSWSYNPGIFVLRATRRSCCSQKIRGTVPYRFWNRPNRSRCSGARPGQTGCGFGFPMVDYL
jgi:hypothetical protein